MTAGGAFQLTIFCREYIFISHQFLNQTHDEVNILGSCAFNLFTFFIMPEENSERQKVPIRQEKVSAL